MMKNDNYDRVRMLSFADLGDERGSLIVVEGAQQVPFEIKRVFYMYGSDADVVRGQHANRRTEFVLINVAGQSKERVDDGCGREEVFSLDKPNTGIYIPRMVWKCTTFRRTACFWSWPASTTTAANTCGTTKASKRPSQSRTKRNKG